MKKCLFVSLTLAMLLTLPAKVFALAGELSSPGIAVREGQDHKKVYAALKPGFVSGYFFNSFTTLFYAGDAKDLNTMITGLSDAGYEVEIRFFDGVGQARKPFGAKKEAPQVCQWIVQHDGNSLALQINVYLGDGKVRQADVAVPMQKIKG